MVLLGGCVLDTSQSSQREDVGQGDEDECKIEGAAIGQVGATVTANGVTVTFLDWVPKADSPGEYVGFTLSAEAGGMHYKVKTGTDVYDAWGTEWTNPNGDSGPDVKGISNVDFCEPCDYDAGTGEPIP